MRPKSGFIAGSIIGNGSRVAGTDTLATLRTGTIYVLVSSAVLLVAALLGIAVVRRLTARQVAQHEVVVGTVAA